MLYDEVEKLIGYEFRDKSLLETALTHSSYANDYLGDATKGNERLEFLGDAVLDAVVGYELYKLYPDQNEGFLTKLRAEIVCEKSLGDASIALGLNKYLRLGRGEESRSRERISIVADATEALVAAVFIDGGASEASRVALKILGSTIEAAVSGELPGDYKTDLQIFCQKKGITDIHYSIIGEKGPDHAKEFTAAVVIEGKTLGKGTGRSKKQAQIKAAQQALSVLEGKSAL